MRTKRAVSRELEDILLDKMEVLDHGFVRVIDYMGNDSAIVQAARVSYGTGTRKLRNDSGLIRYLLRNDHSTPFEMCEIKLHVKLPIFVARQWVRHRTASINEYSARYSVMDREFYIPDPSSIQLQSLGNKQGRGKDAEKEIAENSLKRIESSSLYSHDCYDLLIQDDVSREISRMVLPGNTYTQWYWKTDLRNLFNFLALRMNPKAQWEIREYAKVIGRIAELWVPEAYKAFKDFKLESVKWTLDQVNVLMRIRSGEPMDQRKSGLSRGEWEDLMTFLETRRYTHGKS